MKQRYLLVFLARINGDLENIFLKTERVAKTRADKIGKEIAKKNNWRYFSKWSETSPQFNNETSTQEIDYV